MTYHDTTIDVRGRQVRMLRGGSGPPLLYLHDTFIVENLWLPFHERLAEHYDVILPMHPGCEGSEATGGIDTMDDLIFHYLDLCNALHLVAPILVGASLGGWVAVEWAVRYSHMLRGLIVLNALGLRVPGALTADVLRLDPGQIRSHLFAAPSSELAHTLVPDLPAPEMLPALLKARQTLARFAWQFPDNPKLARYLYRVTIPTLILWGEQDQFIPSAFGQAYHNAIAGSEWMLLPGCGHLPQVEQAQACIDAVTAYLTRHRLFGAR
jgi:pimeloyl-ACP methyl ester carboxylesterase